MKVLSSFKKDLLKYRIYEYKLFNEIFYVKRDNKIFKKWSDQTATTKNDLLKYNSRFILFKTNKMFSFY